ncbi:MULTISPECIES: hypothetical protein [Haloferax]|uniref:Lipoprotein n=2 Tax=Haloferax gibbonsii TaxID=35746 RepID=A0A0K1IZF1_HALGI|nr:MULTISPECIES: hypothetical protein [Haloferax]AKU09690.1 hypothetical protein ABY42_17960 [Haloferax gibbonsii]ELZ75826.1 hypothetical protein C454_19259 [Haloferax gibbonsii ATCC 33959]QOS14069.1 uncharacterized protein HfgLR_24425 [Haloferax gibbonsii]RDZ50770.1 hypothetical protein C5C07_18300 [Haloferax sp. Atlit-4N]REA01564.1 hypothetical protein DEQ92_16835 [Haloferax sp. Atlit-6N]
MSLPTRRQVLQAGGASLVAALAGCSGEGSSSSLDEPRGPSPDALVTDYDALTVRNDAETGIFRDAAREDEDTGSSYLDDFLVTTDEERENVAVAAEPDGIDEARAFIDETEFDAQTLVITQHRTDACHRVKLLYVTHPPDSAVHLDFCHPLRPASVECSVDDRHVVASLVRLPYSSKGESSWGHGGGSSCRLPPSLRTETEDA